MSFSPPVGESLKLIKHLNIYLDEAQAIIPISAFNTNYFIQYYLTLRKQKQKQRESYLRKCLKTA